MDLESYSRWYDYSRARDDMLAATDTLWAPWYIAHTDDKKRARLNIISHLLWQVPYSRSEAQDRATQARGRREVADVEYECSAALDPDTLLTGLTGPSPPALPAGRRSGAASRPRRTSSAWGDPEPAGGREP